MTTVAKATSLTGRDSHTAAEVAQYMSGAVLARAVGSLSAGRVLPMGDSLGTGSSGVIGNYTSGNSGKLHRYAGGIWDHLIAASGGKYRQIGNLSVGGKTAVQIESEQLPSALTSDADIVPFFAGANDLGNLSPDSDHTTMLQACERIIIALLNAGKLPVFGCCPPKNSAGGTFRKNLPLCQMLAQYYKIPFIDFYTPLVDPATGDMVSGYDDDGVHLSKTGLQRVLDTCATRFADLGNAGAGAYLAPVAETVSTNWWQLVRNGTFAAGSSPAATDWTIDATGATVTKPDAVYPRTGKTLTYVKAGDTSEVIALSGASLSAVADHKLGVAGRLKVAGLTPSDSGYKVALSIDRSAFDSQPICGWTYNGDFIFDDEATFATTVSVEPELRVQAAGTYEMNNFTVWDKTAALAIFTPGAQ